MTPAKVSPAWLAKREGPARSQKVPRLSKRDRAAWLAERGVTEDPPVSALLRGCRVTVVDHRLSEPQPCERCQALVTLLFSATVLGGDWRCQECTKQVLEATALPPQTEGDS